MVTLTLLLMTYVNMYPQTTYIKFDDMIECEKYKDYLEQYYTEKLTPHMVHCDENKKAPKKI